MKVMSTSRLCLVHHVCMRLEPSRLGMEKSTRSQQEEYKTLFRIKTSYFSRTRFTLCFKGCSRMMYVILLLFFTWNYQKYFIWYIIMKTAYKYFRSSLEHFSTVWHCHLQRLEIWLKDAFLIFFPLWVVSYQEQETDHFYSISFYGKHSKKKPWFQKLFKAVLVMFIDYSSVFINFVLKNANSDSFS